MLRSWLSAPIVALLVCAAVLAQQSQVIVTYAGGGSGDGGSAEASALTLSTPGILGFAVGPGDILYIAERANNRIRQVSADGIITTIAGTTAAGFSGDGGPGSLAQLNWPGGLALDGAGNLYIADSFNHRVRKLLPDGTILTVAGTGVSGYSGDGGPATLAQLGQPDNVILDSAGNLYISDTGANVVRKIALNGTISTVAGNGLQGFGGDGGPATAALLNWPEGLVFDSSGALCIADFHNSRVRKVTADGKIATIAGDGTPCWGACGDGGPASAAEVYGPLGLAVDGAGNLYIDSVFNHNIREVTSDGKISTYLGTPGQYGFAGDGGNRTKALLYLPTNLAFDGQGNLFVVDGGNNRIRKVTAGTVSTVAGSGSTAYTGDGGPATAAQLDQPYGVAVDASGNVFIADMFDNRVREVLSDGTITTIAGTGVPGFNGDGPATTSELFNPTPLAFNGAGTLFIGDTFNARIRDLQAGQLVTVAGNGLNGFKGDGGPAIGAEFFGVSGLAFDAAGNLYFSDFHNHLVRMVTVGGTIWTFAGTGTPGSGGDGGPPLSASLSYPYGLAFDSHGNLYISEAGGNRIRMVSPAGTVSTVAGNGTAGYSGDGGPATAAQLKQSSGHCR